MKKFVKFSVNWGLLFFATGAFCLAQETSKPEWQMTKTEVFGVDSKSFSGGGFGLNFQGINPTISNNKFVGHATVTVGYNTFLFDLESGALVSISPGRWIGASITANSTQYSAALGPVFRVFSQSGPHQTFDITISPLMAVFFNQVHGEKGVGGRYGIKLSEPLLSNSVRALISGSILKSYENPTDLDAAVQVSLECDVYKGISVNLGICAQSALIESTDPITKIKDVQALGTGPMLRGGVSYRVAE